VKQTVQQANELIGARCKELGIPERFQPAISAGWYGRGENASKERRSELTRVAHSKIDQLLQEAKHAIARASVAIQAELIADGLTSADAKVFLEKMPDPAALLPAVSIKEVQKQLGGRIETGFFTSGDDDE
jgi:hypothetical protein